MIAKSYRWQFTAIAAAVVMGLCATNANALSLGRVSVQSALGAPLRAEIEVLDINADEASSLVTKVATPDAFKAAGLDYNVAMTSLQATLQRRPDGSAYIKLSSDRVIQDPFVDLILEARWNTGRIVRDYTMLFDPPSLRSTNNATVTPAQIPQVKPSTSQRPMVAANPQTQTPRTAPSSVTKSVPQPQANEAESKQVIVKAGDTAGRIAATHQPANVSLDQMLVAMLRANPDAFISGNVNRIKAGALVTLPTQAQASETPAAQARQLIVAQSQDFNNFRRNLAGNAPTAPVTANGREAIGKLQTHVEDKKPGAATPDKLTLSKGAVSSKTNEDQLAQAQNAKAAASRAAEVAKNLQDLSQVAAASSAAAPASSSSAAQPAPTLAAPAASAATSVAVQVPVVATATSAPAAPAPVAEPSFMDNLLEDPLVPLGAAVLIALLAGLGFYKARQRKSAAAQDSTFGDSRLQSESFFGNSGGKNVNTSDSNVTGSSMIYSPSQLDAVDDVDPVAEADVYLAYGRDLQAEEILKDALRTRPERLTIHQKLLEIYAKRRDAKAFEAVATLAFNLTNGLGSDWEQICEKGLALDADNALYLPGGQPHYDPSAPTRPAGIDTVSPGLSEASPAASPAAHELVAGNSELDLDLDFSLDEPDLPDGVAESVKAPEPTESAPTTAHTNDVAWSEPEPMELMALEAAMNQAGTSGYAPLPENKPELDAPAPEFMLESEPEPEPVLEPVATDHMEFDKTQVLSVPALVDEPTPVSESGMMEFDLGSLSLDFANTKPGELSRSEKPSELSKTDVNEETESQAGTFPEVTGDPLETKLALAEEFKAIGDDDGARALIEEVIGEANGDMKAKAQLALSRL